ncbi:hypothetical protein JX265_012216 [Neoarthrinium moseri]|uniref:2EXR domain-containing protein n=1 Tax=Neoarthrinium moseri TaxID=1658444 RepID=A0A9P9WAY3_9PEZI|nr:hypothetical protein JX266_010566 [Neoarthrinium moseri]KAI1855771.1 hypothetical protein JX265_012216 [Neoarthrinium moseri]
MTSTVFAVFPGLPPELRQKIWRDSLPERRPTLYAYKGGCWRPRQLTESDRDYDPQDPEPQLRFDFYHDLLDAVEIKTCLVHVNHEACQVTLAWAREQGMQVRRHQEGSPPWLAQPANPKLDVLYVDHDRWDEFSTEAYDRIYKPGRYEKMVDVDQRLRYIAVPESFLAEEDAIALACNFFGSCLSTLYIIRGPMPDFRATSENGQLHSHWEIEPDQGAWYWDWDRGAFEVVDSQFLTKTHQDIKKACQESVQSLIGKRVYHLTVRSAVVVRIS